MHTLLKLAVSRAMEKTASALAVSNKKYAADRDNPYLRTQERKLNQAAANPVIPTNMDPAAAANYRKLLAQHAAQFRPKSRPSHDVAPPDNPYLRTQERKLNQAAANPVIPTNMDPAAAANYRKLLAQHAAQFEPKERQESAQSLSDWGNPTGGRGRNKRIAEMVEVEMDELRPMRKIPAQKAVQSLPGTAARGHREVAQQLQEQAQRLAGPASTGSSAWTNIFGLDALTGK